jgi:hypothetical protein
MGWPDQVTATHVIATILLIVEGVFTGILCAVGLERVWIWDQMDLRDYAVDFRRSMLRIDIVQPALLIVTIALASIFAARTSGSTRVETIVALACLVGILAGSVLVLVPLQKEFRSRAEGEVPPNAASIRGRWRIGHFIRTALGLAAFVLVVHAVTYA